MRLLYLIRRRGILNLILLLVATYGIMSFILTIVFIQEIHTPTVSEIADSRKETIPFDTLTEKQLQEGTMVEGKILFNMGEFTKSVDENKEKYTHYAILLDDKVMSFAIDDVKEDSSLHLQASNYRQLLAQNSLSIWQYHAENNGSQNKKKKSKKNKKTVKQVIQENMKYEPGIAFKGKVVKMDSTTEVALRDYVIPEGETEPVFEIVPYVIKSVRPVDLGGLILTYVIIALEGIVGFIALCIYILRMRAHKYYP